MAIVIIQKRNIDNIGYALAILGFLFTNAALYGSHWTSNTGIWDYTCGNSKNCKISSYIYSARAFICISTIVMVCAFVFDRVNKFKDMMSSEGQAHMAVGCLWIFAAICALISLACFTSWTPKNTSYGWSYAMGWVGLVLELVAGGLFIWWDRV